MWFTENWIAPAAVLLVVAVVFGVIWNATRRGVFAALAGACIALIPVAYGIEQAVVTPAEQVEQEIAGVRDAVVRGDVDATLAYFSPTAEVERGMVRAGMQMADVGEDLHVTDVNVTTHVGDTQAVSLFRANGTASLRGAGSRHVATYWEVSWRKEAGAWKIFQVKRLNPMSGEPIGLLAGN